MDVALGRALARVAAAGGTNLHVFGAARLPALLPALLPASWRGLEVASLASEDGDEGIADGEGEGVRLEWLLALWEFLGREHASVPLVALTGWPLLPSADGDAYALPRDAARGSRMLIVDGEEPALVRCLCAAGCLRLHADVSRAHPQLAAYVHRVTACSVLRALEAAAAAAGTARGMGHTFDGVGVADRRALRAMLGSDDVEERELRRRITADTLRALPIYEVHGEGHGAEQKDGGEGDAADADADAADSAEATDAADAADAGEGASCVSLSVDEHRLAPADVAAALLDGRFVRCVVSGEEGLVRFAGVVQLTRARFYREHVFPRVGELPAAEREAAMVRALHELHALGTEDAGFAGALRELRFVPVASGALRRADELFHPRVSEAAELLDGAEVFPSGAFASAEVLSVLERLGMRVAVTRGAVLRSARSVEALAAAGEHEAARARARRLLALSTTSSTTCRSSRTRPPSSPPRPPRRRQPRRRRRRRRDAARGGRALPRGDGGDRLDARAARAAHPMLPWAAARGGGRRRRWR